MGGEMIPTRPSLPPCSKLSRRGLETSECAAIAERRPAVTASARVGVGNLRSGQKKACGAVEQKKGPTQESKSARKKVLAFVAAIRERKDGLCRGDQTKGYELRRAERS